MYVSTFSFFFRAAIVRSIQKETQTITVFVSFGDISITRQTSSFYYYYLLGRMCRTALEQALDMSTHSPRHASNLFSVFLSTFQNISVPTLATDYSVCIVSLPSSFVSYSNKIFLRENFTERSLAG
jgi:hypothetical protein